MMSKFIDFLMTKPASEAIEILATKYAEVQEAKRTNHVKSAAGMYDSVLKSFADMPEEAKRALIGGAAGAGIGGLGSLGAGYVKHKKLRLSDALYGALAGAVPGAALGALSAPGAPVAPADPDFIDGPGFRGPLASQGGKVKERPWAFAPIDAIRTMYSPKSEDRVSPINLNGDNLLGVGLGGAGGTYVGARLGRSVPVGVLDAVGALNSPKLSSNLESIFLKNKKDWSEAERAAVNKWGHPPSGTTSGGFKPHGNDRFLGFSGGASRRAIKNVGGIAGGLLGFLTGANAGGAVSNVAGDARSAIRDYQNKP
jgi:hypothetical protein